MATPRSTLAFLVCGLTIVHAQAPLESAAQPVVPVMATPMPAESLLNAFIATYAKENIAWKTEIAPITDPSRLPPGKQLGQSVSLGFYCFRPKLYSELSPEEQSAAQSDPRLPAFIISTLSASRYPAIGIQEPAEPKFPIEGAVSTPHARPLLPVVAPPPSGPVTNVTVTTEQLASNKPVEIQLKP